MCPITGDIEIIVPEILLSLRADIEGNVLKELSNALSRDSNLRKGNFKKPSFVFTMIRNHSSSRHGSQILSVLLATKPDLRRDFLTKSECMSAVVLSPAVPFPSSINKAILTPLDLHNFTRVLRTFVNAYGVGYAERQDRKAEVFCYTLGFPRKFQKQLACWKNINVMIPTTKIEFEHVAFGT